MVRAVPLVIVIGLLMAGSQQSFAQSGEGHPSTAIMVSGNDDETLELSFLLREHALVDGDMRLMTRTECEAEFSLKASGATGASGKSAMTRQIVLGPGDFEKLELPFSSFSSAGTGHALLTFAWTRRAGPCALLSSVRVTGPNGRTRAMPSVIDTKFGSMETQ